MNEIMEFNQLSGTVEFCYTSEVLQESEGIVYKQKFHTLKELLYLTDKGRLQEIKKSLRAVEVSIEAICLNTRTPDSKEKLEFLLMSDEFYGQSIRTL